MHTRNAILPDAQQIHALINGYSQNGTLLPRSLPELYENVRDFIVVEAKINATLIGFTQLLGELD